MDGYRCWMTTLIQLNWQQMNEPLHSYLTTTASITTQWFFFACTINVAIAVLVTSRREGAGNFGITASVLASILGTADLVLALVYFPCIPIYYAFSYFSAGIKTYHLMVTLTAWSLIASALALQLVLISYLWFRASFRHNEDIPRAIQNVKSDLGSVVAWVHSHLGNGKNRDKS